MTPREIPCLCTNFAVNVMLILSVQLLLSTFLVVNGCNSLTVHAYTAKHNAKATQEFLEAKTRDILQ